MSRSRAQRYLFLAFKLFGIGIFISPWIILSGMLMELETTKGVADIAGFTVFIVFALAWSWFLSDLALNFIDYSYNDNGIVLGEKFYAWSCVKKIYHKYQSGIFINLLVKDKDEINKYVVLEYSYLKANFKREKKENTNFYKIFNKLNQK